MKTPGWKILWVSVMLLNLAFSAGAGVGIRWSTQWGAYNHAATDLTGGDGALLDSYSATWQLIYAGADNIINPPNLTNSSAGCVSGDDVVWAVRSIPQGGGSAADGTSWDNWMLLTSGNPVYENLGWSTTGYVYMRLYEGTPVSGTWFFDSSLTALNTGYTGSPQLPQDIYPDTMDHGFKPDQQVFGNTAPVVAIRTANTTVGYATSNLTVSGSGYGLAGALHWTNSLGGGGSLAAAASWSFLCPLYKGTNVITVQGTNSTGAAASDALTVIRTGSAAPVPVVVSAAMREGTTLMDVVYRVDDPDDATVSAYPLAFVDGVRSFDNVIRPVTFEEGTAANFGAAIAANTNHTLTWNVAADWNVDLGQLKFEIICKDARGLLSFDWLTIPATTNSVELTISQNSPSTNEVLNALFYLYASGDPGLELAEGVLSGSAASGIFSGNSLVDGDMLKTFAAPYVLKQMDLDPAAADEIALALAARSGLVSSNGWHATARSYDGMSVVYGWGTNGNGQITSPEGVSSVMAIAAGGNQSYALKSDGNVVGWGAAAAVPNGLSGVIDIKAGNSHAMALKSDGSVWAWGNNSYNQTNVPAGLTNATAIAAGGDHCLALKRDTTVACWGRNTSGQATPPGGLSNVTAIAAGRLHSVALKQDGTIVVWGSSLYGQTNMPAGLSNVIAIAANGYHTLALKTDGTVVAWGGGSYDYGQSNVPVGLSNVIAVAAGRYHSLALKNDGTIVGWGLNDSGQINIPTGIAGATAIAGGDYHSLALKPNAE